MKKKYKKNEAKEEIERKKLEYYLYNSGVVIR
jgi:hypothetical protein